ncbi:DUF4335 domain-containing protein [Pleurocapsa sp. FMAR1]|uniref:DUF4335 domain-containing protein n=1 Tax=Pleurocapsa sp. FMAR1 TaxID=3040204 RepID=UPI0029C983B7|nr:DUF4335 domain-containing protein [Pleurocapsa sp. FMAR1]
MNTKRQYSLPNCNLVLEGMENVDPQSVDILDGKSPMSILINAECNFFNSNQQLSGGSVFLANLSKAVSNYAQGFLSGLSQPHKKTSQYPRISIEQVAEQHCHRLTYELEPGEETRTEVNLTTVELFDLVDAIDQFYADRTTLPNMSLELQSVSKRYRQPEQPLAQRLTPVVLGFTSLAVAAGAFFVIPPPEINTPKPTPVNQTTKTKPVPKPESTPSPTPVPPSNQDK